MKNRNGTVGLPLAARRLFHRLSDGLCEQRPYIGSR